MVKLKNIKIGDIYFTLCITSGISGAIPCGTPVTVKELDHNSRNIYPILGVIQAEDLKDKVPDNRVKIWTVWFSPNELRTEEELILHRLKKDNICGSLYLK